MTARRTPAERADYCPHCGTAPCSHPDRPHGPPGVDLVVVVVLLALCCAIGLLVGWHAASYGTVLP